MTTRTTPTMKTGSADQPTRSNRILWLAVAAAAVVVAVIAAWLVMDGSSTPTLTFDGEQVTYDGPTTFDAGEVTFVLDSSDYEPGVALVISELNDDTITVEDVEAYAVDNPARHVPPFVEEYEVSFATRVEGDERVIERTVTLDADTRYLLTANTGPSDTDYTYVAAIIEVK